MLTSSKSNRAPAFAMVAVGDELLLGRTKDKNIGVLADALREQGFDFREARIVADDAGAIADAVNALRTAFDHVVVCGGIGPTHDDITCDAVAAAIGVPVVVHPEAERLLIAYYARRAEEARAAGDDEATARLTYNTARARMARTPQGATLIPNALTAAPGFTIENVHVLAGVPAIFQSMLGELLPAIQSSADGPLSEIEIPCDCGEGVIADELRAIQQDHTQVRIGCYPVHAGGGCTIRIRGASDDVIAVAEETRRRLGLARD